MALDGTYTGLQATLASFLKRTDLTSSIPDLIVLAEARIAADLRLRNQVGNTTLTTTGGTRGVAIPTDFLEFENLTLNTTPAQNLTYITPEQMDIEFPDGGSQGRPQAYTVVGQMLNFGPVPDQAYGIGVSYYQRISPLATTPTNWLLSNYPGVYLFGTLCEAAPFLLEDQRVALWEQKYGEQIAALQTTDDRALRSGSVLRVRPIV